MEFIIGIILGLAQQAAAAEEARKQRRQAEIQRKQREAEERRAALHAEKIAREEIQMRQLAEQAEAAAAADEAERATTSAKRTAQTVAGEQGSFGYNYQSLIAEYSQRQAEFNAGIEQNLALANQRAALDLEAAKLNTDTRFRNARRPATPRLNYTNFALAGLAQGLSYGNALKSSGLLSGSGSGSKSRRSGGSIPPAARG